MANEELKGHLDVLLLAVIADGPVHGYAIVERLHSRSDGHFELPEGTVYPALHRLEADRLLSSDWAVVDGRRRRLYPLTKRGRSALGQRSGDWRRFAGAVERVITTTAPARAEGGPA